MEWHQQHSSVHFHKHPEMKITGQCSHVIQHSQNFIIPHTCRLTQKPCMWWVLGRCARSVWQCFHCLRRDLKRSQRWQLLWQGWLLANWKYSTFQKGFLWPHSGDAAVWKAWWAIYLRVPAWHLPYNSNYDSSKDSNSYYDSNYYSNECNCFQAAWKKKLGLLACFSWRSLIMEISDRTDTFVLNYWEDFLLWWELSGKPGNFSSFVGYFCLLGFFLASVLDCKHAEVTKLVCSVYWDLQSHAHCDLCRPQDPS